MFIENLRVESTEGRNRVYNPNTEAVKIWLQENWTFGYNPLATDDVNISNVMRLTLPDGSEHYYSDPSHAFQYYRKNKDREYPNYLVHCTQSGWVEYAIRENNGCIGKENEIWTASWDPKRWWGGKFPKNYVFKKPENRFVELMFDANKLKELGFTSPSQTGQDYFVFRQRIPLAALIPTSKAYLYQVMDLEVPN